MATILVVDDSPFDRYLAGALLAEHPGWRVIYVEDGREALAFLRRETPDLVLTDLLMPEINGLELVEAIGRDFAGIPVVLMTAHGSEEIAADAIRAGAASYVPKKDLAMDLIRTVEDILTVTQKSRDPQRFIECKADNAFRFILTNDTSCIQPLIGHLQDHLVLTKMVTKSGLIRVGTALHEALTNAIEHGNLELSSELRASDDQLAYRRLVEERRRLSPYRERRVHVSAEYHPRQATFVIRDEGPGFDTSNLPDPTDPTNLERVHGRGLFLIRTFMDEVQFNSTGNEITMVTRRK